MEGLPQLLHSRVAKRFSSEDILPSQNRKAWSKARKPPSAKLDSNSRLLRSRFRRARFTRSILTYQPADDSDRSQSQCAVFEKSAGRRRTRFRIQKRAVHLGPLIRWRRPSMRATLRRGNPSRNRRKHLGRANRTLHGVMHLFAIEAEASVSELHLSSVLKPIGKPARLRNAERGSRQSRPSAPRPCMR
jgi:hypothetical protein